MTCPSTPEEWQQVADNYFQRWNFPHTCGAINCKHVACKAPAISVFRYYNYKGFFSVILFAMVKADYKFLWVDVSTVGSCSDAQIYNDSELNIFAINPRSSKSFI